MFYIVVGQISSLRDVCHDDNENPNNDRGYWLFKRVGIVSLDTNLNLEDKMFFSITTNPTHVQIKELKTWKN